MRKEFIDFFKSKDHDFIRSSSVVPVDDPTLLFTNAGMNQFKPIFLDKEKTLSTRLVNSQKCIRVSGKHNDLEEVGVDDYHHTFFEMLGNWSFGDYYKQEAIVWAWELLTKVWKIDKKRLWISVYKDDDETEQLWKSKTDIDHSRILRFGKKENFWEMGETGPCGPCTEIHYFFGNNIDDQDPNGVNNEEMYREIWNLVFIQYNRSKDGSLTDLPNKHVDTGMGLERILSVLNDNPSNYETDLFKNIIDDIKKITKKEYSVGLDGIPHRVIADHIRMLCFSIADGAIPSNDGRGYVLRRVLRRASRFGRNLGMKDIFLYKLVDAVIRVMGDSFPEIEEKKKHIINVIKSEEESFNQTLDNGLDVFETIVKNLSSNDLLSGSDAFKLYDTYGFPFDLTKLMAKEKNIKVDEMGFDKCMKEQKQRSRSQSDFNIVDEGISWVEIENIEKSNFVGYDQTTSKSNIIKYRALNDDIYEIILSDTPFYGESGGQVGDKGVIENEELNLDVFDTKLSESQIIHKCKLNSGEISLNQIVNLKIDNQRRLKIKANHTATHLLHESLKRVLGDHVQQSGSLVNEYKLRFDLTHYEKITKSQIKEIEYIVNEKIRSNIQLNTKIQSFDDAKRDGAVALFGEKYTDKVRVIDVPGFSKELCGGTHVDRTGDIGMFKIISESSLSTGIRRIEAITGQEVLNRIQELDIIIDQTKLNLRTTEDRIVEKTNLLIAKNKDLEKKLKYGETNKVDFNNILSNSTKIGETKVVLHDFESYEGDLKQFADKFRAEVKGAGILLLSSNSTNKVNYICSVTDKVISTLDAINICKKIGNKINGGGGGKPHLATAGGKNNNDTEKVFDYILKYVESKLMKG
ncbi:MAG: alanine--tRNA ligase [Candidatus Pelagibacter sp. TMED166]|nr:MAG: alanine--tRNA ligase [Candidatus Pelagibacter sp. TMED166]